MRSSAGESLSCSFIMQHRGYKVLKRLSELNFSSKLNISIFRVDFRVIRGFEKWS